MTDEQKKQDIDYARARALAREADEHLKAAERICEELRPLFKLVDTYRDDGKAVADIDWNVSACQDYYCVLSWWWRDGECYVTDLESAIDCMEKNGRITPDDVEEAEEWSL